MARTETIGDNGKGLGERIREGRVKAGMPATELAAIIGVTEGALRQIESGLVKVPSAVVLLRIARALRIEANALVFGTDPATSREPEETFAVRLRRLRQERRMSFTKLAIAVGVTEGALRQMESGQTKWPAFPVGIRLAHVLGVEPRDLAFGESDGTEFSPDVLALPPSRTAELEKKVAGLTKRVIDLERRVRAGR